MPNAIQSIQRCHSDIVEQCTQEMRSGSEPKIKHINGQSRPYVEIAWPERFVPKTVLRRTFTLEKTIQLLRHPCAQCAWHLPEDGLALLSLEHPRRILESDAALCLFGLLVKLQIPRLIGAFLSTHELTTMPMPQAVTQHQLQTRYFEHFPELSRIQFAEDFGLSKYQFSAPNFEDKSIQIYDIKTILPYLDEELIDQGAFGRVFKVTVHPSYCQMYYPQANRRNYPPKILARKEFSGDIVSFVKEKSNLDKLEALRHDHLIRIQKTYQIGDKFNILLPFASKGNLQNYLRNRNSSAPRHRHVSKNPIWEQMMGITKGLEAIINFKDPTDSSHTFFGYHLDLKPQNILVDSDNGSRDTWKISDMGQTEFVDTAFAGTSASNRIGNQGTDAYAPPEYRGGSHNRQYDVWSLGIILLEVLTFAIKGPDGLKNPQNGLDYVRYTKDEIPNHRFYTGVGPTAIVKPEILEWIDAVLLKDPSLREEDKVFANKVIALTKRMLRTQVVGMPANRLRITVENVVNEMKSIFDVQTTGSIEETVEELAQDGETTLVELQQVDFYRNMRAPFSEKSSLIVFEDHDNNLRIFVGRYIRNVINHREHIRLILNFQHTREDDDDGSYKISFTAMEPRIRIALGDTCFSLNDRAVARRLQSSLLQQKVSYRYKVTELIVKPYSKPYRAILRRPKLPILDSRLPEGDEDLPQMDHVHIIVPTWIELWLENPRYRTEPALMVNRTDSAASAHPPLTAAQRLNRVSNPAQEIPLGRVIIYCTDRIVVIPFQRECKINGDDHEKQIPTCQVNFEPMDVRQRMYFSVSTIEAKDQDLQPGIPMYLPRLQETVAKQMFHTKKVSVTFDTPDEAAEFYELYMNEKTRWLSLIEGKEPEWSSNMPQN